MVAPPITITNVRARPSCFHHPLAQMPTRSQRLRLRPSPIPTASCDVPGSTHSIAMPAALIGAAFFAISLATNFCR